MIIVTIPFFNVLMIFNITWPSINCITKNAFVHDIVLGSYMYILV